MTLIEREQVFPTPVERGFSFITDVGKWPSYWPGLVRIEPESHWGTPGDQARVIVRLFGRDVELALTLREFVPFQLVHDSVRLVSPTRTTSATSAIDGGFATGSRRVRAADGASGRSIGRSFARHLRGTGDDVQLGVYLAVNASGDDCAPRSSGVHGAAVSLRLQL